MAALGEQLENGKTEGNFVGLITRGLSVSVLLSPSQFSLFENRNVSFCSILASF